MVCVSVWVHHLLSITYEVKVMSDLWKEGGLTTPWKVPSASVLAAKLALSFIQTQPIAGNDNIYETVVD
jgi:hypothetical protein